jgi:hypothetical protein
MGTFEKRRKDWVVGAGAEMDWRAGWWVRETGGGDGRRVVDVTAITDDE